MARLEYHAPDSNARSGESRHGAIAAIGIIALIVAATAVGFAIHLHGGEYSPGAITLVTVAIIATAVGLIASKSTRLEFPYHGRLARVGSPETHGRDARDTGDQIAAHALSSNSALPWIEYSLALAIALQFVALVILWPVGVDQIKPYLTLKNQHVYLYLISTSAFIVLPGFLRVPSMRRWWFPALLLVHLMLGFWAVRSSPVPHIDVWYFQESGAQTLLQGHNPYDYRQANYPDIYDSTLPGHQRVYGEGMVEDGRLKFGFPYPPISLFCSTLGFFFGNDTRFAQAVALTLAGLCIGYSRPGLIPKLAATLLMFTPSVWFVLGRGWTEPFVVMFLAATVFCASRNLRWLLPMALGLFLASKQYLVFAIPLSFLLLPNFEWRKKASWRDWILLLLEAAAVAAIVTLPLALWNFHAFWFSLVTVQKEAPFRWDALSYLVWIGFNVDSKYTTWVWMAFAGVTVAMFLSFWKARRDAMGFVAAMALVYLVFIAFNKQAFCNYYFFVIGCLCCALGSAPDFSRSTAGDIDSMLHQ